MDTVRLEVPFRDLLLSLDPSILLVGGAVRDAILGKIPYDFDFLSEKAFDVAKEFSERIGGKSYHLRVTERRKTISVVKPPYTFDFSLLDTSLEENLRARDFTMNTVTCSLSEFRLFDPLNGVDDIRKRIIKVVSPFSFDIDPGRILRAFRFLILLDFKLEEKTSELIRKKRSLVKKLQPERIRFELYRIVPLNGAYKAISSMMKHSVLSEMIPELERCVGCSQNIYHAYDVWTHTLKALEFLENLEGYESLTQEERFVVKMALLLHDVGKPATKSGESPQEIHFYGHEGESARVVRKVSENLGFSKKEESSVERLVLYHMRPMEMAKRMEKGELSRREVERFIRKNEDILKLFYFVVISDIKAKGVDVERDVERAERFFEYLFDYYEKVYLPKKRKPIIRGRDLIEWGFTPSPLFREILSFVEEMELKGVIKTKEEAKKLVLSRWKPR